MKYLTSEGKPVCTSGWPQEHGYPHCETSNGEDMAVIRPNSYLHCPVPKPATLDQLSGIARRPRYRDEVPKPKGAHSFYNVMWDGRVRRGDPLNRTAKKEEEEIQKILEKLKQPRLSKPRFQPRSHSFGATHNEAARALEVEADRQSKLALSSLIPKDKFAYFVELTDFIDDTDPCYKGRRLQPLREFPVAPARKCEMIDIGTQIWPGDLFEFDTQVVPLMEKLLGSVLHRAHIELLEEDELHTHRLQIQNNRIKKETVLKNIERLREREAKRAAEEERLAQAELDALKNMTDFQRRYFYCTGAGAVTQPAIIQCIGELEASEEEAFMWNQIIRVEFVNWVNEGVAEQVKRNDLCRRLLDDILAYTVENREAEYAAEYWKDLLDEANLQKHHQVEPYPPTPGTSVFEGEGGEDMNGSQFIYGSQ